MKALVLSSGRGARLRPFTHSMSKQLMPIANKPILNYVLDKVRDIGVTDVGIIVGEHADEIFDVIGDGSPLGINVTYIWQHKPLGLAHCVLAAKSFLGSDDFVMCLGDNFLPEGIGEVADRFAETRPAAQVVVQKVADPRGFGVVEVDGNGSVLGLQEKPSEPRSDLVIVGIYFFTAAIHQAVAAISFSARGELEITDAIQWLVSHGTEVTAYDYRGYWKDIGEPAAVLECNRRMLGELRSAIAGEVDSASVVTGPVVVEPGARVVRSTIHGPVIIGANALIEGCVIGPDASIGRDCVLRDAGLSDSIVLEGAKITGIPWLRGSLVGRSAVLGADERALPYDQLFVGDHSRIDLAVRPGTPATVRDLVAGR